MVRCAGGCVGVSEVKEVEANGKRVVVEGGRIAGVCVCVSGGQQ